MKVLIVDDHPLVRKGLNTILTLEGMDVVGEARNHKDAIELFKTKEADLALIDLRLGDESGLDLIAEALQLKLGCKFIVLTSSTDETDFTRAKKIGVDGYVLKEALPEELIHALRVIARGRKYYDPGVMDLLIDSNNPVQVDGQFEQLTPKEKEVLLELGMGHSNKEISQKLDITEYTVKKHVSQVLAKLNLADRTHAALYANVKGLVTYVVN
jgi:two-component system, NarL family, nitrate/nitrite response regulator NarL